MILEEKSMKEVVKRLLAGIIAATLVVTTVSATSYPGEGTAVTNEMDDWVPVTSRLI